MDRLQYNMETGEFNYRAHGTFGAATEFLHEASGTTKAFSTVASGLALADEMGWLPAMGVNLSETSATFLHAAGVTAFPHALESGMKMYKAGRDLLANPSWDKAGKFTSATAKTVTKSSEALAALHKSHAINLGEAGLHGVKVAKSCAAVVADAFSHSTALAKDAEVRGSTAAELNMSDATYSLALDEAWWDVIRTIAAIAFHLMVSLIVVFSITSISMNATLALAAIYVTTIVVHHFNKSALEDARGRDMGVSLHLRNITVNGIPNLPERSAV